VRIVIDTNIWVSGLLWRGLPWQLLRLAEQGAFDVCMAPAMLTELAEVLAYEHLQPRLAELRLNPAELVAYAMNLATVFEVMAESAPIVTADPDDDVVIRCAVIARADYIVSGDRHLLNLGEYASIPILTVHDFLDRLPPPTAATSETG